MLLRAIVVEQSDSSWNEQPAVVFLFPLWVKQSVAEGAA